MWEKKHKLHSRHVDMLMRGVARGRIYADFKRLRSAVWSSVCQEEQRLIFSFIFALMH